MKPEDCIKKGCCYDDMFMSERNFWYYNPAGRVWCFTKKGGGKQYRPDEDVNCSFSMFGVP